MLSREHDTRRQGDKKHFCKKIPTRKRKTLTVPRKCQTMFTCKTLGHIQIEMVVRMTLRFILTATGASCIVGALVGVIVDTCGKGGRDFIALGDVGDGACDVILNGPFGDSSAGGDESGTVPGYAVEEHQVPRNEIATGKGGLSELDKLLYRTLQQRITMSNHLNP